MGVYLGVGHLKPWIINRGRNIIILFSFLFLYKQVKEGDLIYMNPIILFFFLVLLQRKVRNSKAVSDLYRAPARVSCCVTGASPKWLILVT